MSAYCCVHQAGHTTANFVLILYGNKWLLIHSPYTLWADLEKFVKMTPCAPVPVRFSCLGKKRERKQVDYVIFKKRQYITVQLKSHFYIQTRKCFARLTSNILKWLGMTLMTWQHQILKNKI